MSSIDHSPQDESVTARPSNREAARALILLTLTYFFYMLDRNAILITQEAFKREFGLSDTQVGVIVGVMYGAAYAVFGLPLGYLVDRVNRPRLLGALVGIWSSFTAICGLAQNFWQLAASRFVIGAAESGCAPASLSILSDLYPPSRRATVAGIFLAGSGLGVTVSSFAGGHIAAHFGWRAVFIVYGLPGLLLGLAIILFIKDPIRHVVKAAPATAGVWRTVIALLRNRALLPTYIGAVLYTFVISGVSAWLVPYFMRIHGFSLQDAGMTVALGYGVAGVLGGVLAGFATDRAERRWRGATLWLVAAAAALNLFFALCLAAAPSALTAICLLPFLGFTMLCYTGPTNAAVSRLCPPAMRGTGFALYQVLCNFIGASLGPLVAGMVSDAYSAEMGVNSVRPAIMAVASAQIFTVIAYLLASKRWQLAKMTE